MNKLTICVEQQENQGAGAQRGRERVEERVWKERRETDSGGRMAHCKEFEFYPKCDGISWRVLHRK